MDTVAAHLCSVVAVLSLIVSAWLLVGDVVGVVFLLLQLCIGTAVGVGACLLQQVGVYRFCYQKVPEGGRHANCRDGNPALN